MISVAGSPERIGAAIVGAGYWGPNLVRNFNANADCDLLWVCDVSVKRAERAVGRHSTVQVTASLDDILNDPRVRIVAVATPTSSHYELAAACLEAGKHVLVEKPLASSVHEAEKLIRLADRNGLVLMCDHTYCYTPAARRIRQMVAEGLLGEIQYVDSVRINLGLIQSDIDVFWDLAPHDLAILDFILPEACLPVAVAAQGADPIGAGRMCVGYLTVSLSGDAIAHCHVNWLSPTKIRTTMIGGSKRMVVWDDVNPVQRLSLYDKGVDVSSSLRPETRRETMVSYRVGDMVAPALPEQEALQAVVGELVAAIREQRAPLTDGRAGLRVLKILQAASQSLAEGGALVPLDPAITRIAVGASR